jgi:hypothetical protein
MIAYVSVAMSQQPLTNQDIINMAKAGMSDQIIITAIHSQPNHFDLSANNLISLKQAGVSNAVLDAMLKGEAPEAVPASPNTPSSATVRSLGNIYTIFIAGNNEAASNARNDLLKITMQRPNEACFKLIASPKLADATLDIAENDTAGGSGSALGRGMFGGTSLETTVVSGTLSDAAGDLLWSDAKQGTQGSFHTGAGDAARMLLVSLFVANGCQVNGLRNKATHIPYVSGNAAVIENGTAAASGTTVANATPSVQTESITWIRKVYLTGSKERAIKSGPRYLKRYTCLVPVSTPQEAQALVILDQSTVPAMKSLVGINNSGMLGHIYSTANLVTTDRKTTLWSFDEASQLYKGYKGPGSWWAALNQAVGCGKTASSFKRKNNWPTPTPQPAHY